MVTCAHYCIKTCFNMDMLKPDYSVIESPLSSLESRPTVTNSNSNAGRGSGDDSSSSRGGRTGNTPTNPNPQDSDVVKTTNDRIPSDELPSNPNTDDSGDNGVISGRGNRTGNTSMYPDVPPYDWEDISNRINQIWVELLGSRFGSGLSSNLSSVGDTIFGFIQSLAQQIKNGGLGLDNLQRVNLASQIYNITSGYMQMQLQQYYSRENWIFENEYNSPVNQIARLIQAGINPAFYYSSASKDTAGEIGGVEQSTAQLSGIDGMSESQRKQQKLSSALSMLGTIGNVSADMGNLTNLTAQAKLANITGEDIESTRIGRNAQTFANAGYLSALTNKEQVTLPYLKEQMRTTSLLNNAMIENYAVTANQRWAELEQNMRIADNQINSSMWIAKMRAGVDKDIADMTSSRQLQGVKFQSNMAFLGTKYQADRNYDATKYATDEQVKNSRWCKNMDRRMGLELKAMDNMYDDVFFTNYVDETTGKRSHDFAGLGLNVDDYGKVEFGTDGTAMVNGHRIRRDEVKSHVFNYGRMQYANQTILNLVRYNDENYVPSSTMFHYAKEYDNVFNRAFFNWALPKMSAAYGSYITDSFFNIGESTNPTTGDATGVVVKPNAGGLTTGWHPIQK